MKTKIQRHQEKRLPWKMRAYFIDACNCDWGCPCQFNAKPTHGNCEGISGFHIITGRYGKDVRLDGLNMALIASWPGPIHEGFGKAAYYIDNRANEQQFEALSSIITGHAGGGPFEVYSNTIEEYRGPMRASVRFQTRDVRSHVSVLDISKNRKERTGDRQSRAIFAEAWLEPIRNPVTGKVHRAIIEIPTGFESSRMDQASTKKLNASYANLNFVYEGTYGSFSENTWKGP